MGLKDLITKMQLSSGLSSEQSKDALELMVESIAVRLDEPKRRDFALQLPELLQDIALSVYPSEENSRGDLVEQFMQIENLERTNALTQIKAAWQALKDTISDAEQKHIKSILPKSTVLVLS